MRIDVTQEDIEQGRADNCRLCPVALAVARATGKIVKVWEGSISFLYGWSEGEVFYSLDLPEEAKEFISLFDFAGEWAAEEKENGGADEGATWRARFSPFTFDLELRP